MASGPYPGVTIYDVTGVPVSSTSPSSITGTGTAGSAATGVVTVQGIASGTAVTVSGSGNFTVAQATGTNLHAVVDSGVISTGPITAGTSLSAVTANGAGTAVDFGQPVRCISFVVTSTGSPTAGTVTLLVSLDGTSYFTTSTTANVNGTTTVPTSGTLANVAFRYARLDLASLGGGTTPAVTAKVMGV